MTKSEVQISNDELPDGEDEWVEVAEWARSVNESADEAEEREWQAFLDRNLYNLNKLKRPKETDAADR